VVVPKLHTSDAIDADSTCYYGIVRSSPLIVANRQSDAARTRDEPKVRVITRVAAVIPDLASAARGVSVGLPRRKWVVSRGRCQLNFVSLARYTARALAWASEAGVGCQRKRTSELILLYSAVSIPRRPDTAVRPCIPKVCRRLWPIAR
jgi:hypothetical protein